MSLWSPSINVFLSDLQNPFAYFMNLSSSSSQRHHIYALTNDRIEACPELPKPAPSCTCPQLELDEEAATIYYENPAAENVTVVFSAPLSTYVGPPNDETLACHPLIPLGLLSYDTYRVRNSSWIANLAQLTDARLYHEPADLSRYSHYVLTFHDCVFECIALNLQAWVGGSRWTG